MMVPSLYQIGYMISDLNMNLFDAIIKVNSGVDSNIVRKNLEVHNKNVISQHIHRFKQYRQYHTLKESTQRTRPTNYSKSRGGSSKPFTPPSDITLRSNQNQNKNQDIVCQDTNSISDNQEKSTKSSKGSNKKLPNNRKTSSSISLSEGNSIKPNNKVFKSSATTEKKEYQSNPEGKGYKANLNIRCQQVAKILKQGKQELSLANSQIKSNTHPEEIGSYDDLMVKWCLSGTGPPPIPSRKK